MNENFSIDSIIESIKNLELPDVLKDLFGNIASGANHLGRFATGQLLRLYYVLKEGKLSTSEKGMDICSVGICAGSRRSDTAPGVPRTWHH